MLVFKTNKGDIGTSNDENFNKAQWCKVNCYVTVCDQWYIMTNMCRTYPGVNTIDLCLINKYNKHMLKASYTSNNPDIIGFFLQEKMFES